MGEAILNTVGEVINEVPHIVEGHINEFLGNKKAIANPRREICKKCPLYHINDFWGWAECNPKLYINKNTNEVSTTPVAGYYKGCGCRIEAKITVPAEKCPVGKW